MCCLKFPRFNFSILRIIQTEYGMRDTHPQQHTCKKMIVSEAPITVQPYRLVDGKEGSEPTPFSSTSYRTRHLAGPIVSTIPYLVEKQTPHSRREESYQMEYTKVWVTDRNMERPHPVIDKTIQF